jgi:hypothetical protein
MSEGNESHFALGGGGLGPGPWSQVSQMTEGAVFCNDVAVA